MRVHQRIRQAVLLAGGFGTRLGALTASTPKPLLRVGDRPFLDWVIDWLARAGIEDIILSTGYLAEQFDAFIAERIWRDPHGQPIRVRAVREDRPAGTAGALTYVADQLDEMFLFVNGDSLFLCDPVAIAALAERLPPGSMALTLRHVPDTVHFGRIEGVAAAGRGLMITDFREKGVAGPGFINAGVSALHRSVLACVGDLPCSIEQAVYPALAAAGRLFGAAQEGYFVDIGRPDTLAAAELSLPQAFRRKAVFFDRDGVLNVDGGYTHRVEDLALMPGAAEAVAAARRAGWQTVVVSNQAGIARGLYGIDAVHRFNRALNDRLRDKGGWIDRFYFCPFHPDGSVPGFSGDHPDRKPNPGMITRAIAEMGIDPSGSLLIGDQPTDIEAAERASLIPILYKGGPVVDALTPYL